MEKSPEVTGKSHFTLGSFVLSVLSIKRDLECIVRLLFGQKVMIYNFSDSWQVVNIGK